MTKYDLEYFRYIYHCYKKYEKNRGQKVISPVSSENQVAVDDLNKFQDLMIINSFVKKRDLEITNCIYVCLGGYNYRVGKRLQAHYCSLDLLPYLDKKISYEDDQAIYRVYCDIESDLIWVVEKDEWSTFERMNTVFFPPLDKASDYRDDLRLLFYRTCLEGTQEKAIQKILDIKTTDDEEKKNHKRLLIKQEIARIGVKEDKKTN